MDNRFQRGYRHIAEAKLIAPVKALAWIDIAGGIDAKLRPDGTAIRRAGAIN